MYALCWLIAIPLVLVLAGIITNIAEGIAEFHRAGMERVRKLDR
jgi:uncharacterized protein (DUF3084 family)